MLLRCVSLLLAGLGQLLVLTAAAQAPAVLRGRVSNHYTDSISVYWRPEAIDNRGRVASALLSPNGEFELEVPVQRATPAELRCGDAETNIFLEPGDVLQVRFEQDDLLKTLKFKSGSGSASRPAAAANNYLNETNLRILEVEGYQVLPENIKLYESAFLDFLNYRRRRQEKVLRSAGGAKSFSPAFAAYSQAEIKYLYANDLLSYPELREQVVGAQGRITVSDGFYDFLREPGLVPGSEEAPTSPQCQEFMLNYVHHRVQASGLKPTSPAYFPACYELAERTFVGALRPIILGRVLLETFRFGHLKHATALLDAYANQGRAPEGWVKLLRRDLNAHRRLAIGSPAPALPLQTLAGDSLRLAKYRGQLVYVMFWDSRKPQSQRELPYLTELVKEFAGQPIVFVSADFDETPEKLLPDSVKAVKSTVVPAPARPGVRQRYGIASLPAFLLLAEDGTVLDPNPKRLSSRALLDDLHDAFGKAAAYQAVPIQTGKAD